MFFPKTVCKVSEIGDKKMVPFSNETLSNIKRTTSRPERTSVVTFREERVRAGARGSLTIEAALVLPMVAFVLLGFSYFFRIMSLQTRVAETLNRAVEEITSCVEIGEKIPGLFATEQDGMILTQAEEDAKQDILSNFNVSVSAIARHGLKIGVLNVLFDRYLTNEYLDSSPIVNGAGGLSFNGTLLAPDTEYLDARVSYSVHLWGLPPGMNEIDLMQRCRRRYWRGYDTSQNASQHQEDEIVYVTEYGQVYHTYRDCSNLYRRIRTIDMEQVEYQRNEYGGKYYACEVCMQDMQGLFVFITTDGDRYHSRSTCPSLIRYIHEVKKSETGGKPLCSVCAARAAEQNKTPVTEGGD